MVGSGHRVATSEKLLILKLVPQFDHPPPLSLLLCINLHSTDSSQMLEMLIAWFLPSKKLPLSNCEQYHKCFAGAWMVSIRKKCKTIFLDNLHPIFMSELHTSELLTYFEMLLFGRENNIALKEGQPASTQTNKYIPCSKIKRQDEKYVKQKIFTILIFRSNI